MKKHRLSFILLGILFMTMVIGLLSVDGFGQSTDINYTFEKDLIISESNSPISNQFNLRNKSVITDIYNGTYSFTGETGDTSTAIDFIDTDTSGANCGFGVLASLDGHSEVLYAEDNSAVAVADGKNNIANEASGTIEFFIRITDSSKVGVLYIQEGSFANSFNLYISAGDFKYYDTGFNILQSCISNTWYHIRIDFEGSAGGYLGLAVNTMDVYINGILYAGLGSRGDPDLIDEFNLFTDPTPTGYTVYYDAIGYSWDSDYNIGDNIFPYTTYNNTLEVDKYEWTYEGVNNFYEVGDTPIGWSKISSGVAGAITIGGRELDRDKELFFVAGNGVSILGIEKTTFNLDGERFNISLEVYFFQWDDANDDNVLTIKSKDGTDIYVLDIENDGALNYYDGGSFIELDTGLTIGVNYSFNLFIDYFSDTCLIRRYDDGVLDSIYFTPLAVAGKQGLDEVVWELYTFSVGDYSSCLVDSIGVYKDGLSEVVEYGFLSYDCNSYSPWDFGSQYLFTINASGFFTIHGSAGYYFGAVANFENAISERVYSNDLDFINIIETSMIGSGMPNPYLVFYLNESQYYNSLSFVEIEGVYLTDGFSNYSIEFTYGNVNVDESYFYVDSSNRLRGQCYYNDSNLEYIQANFDIDNVLNENRSLRLKSQFSGQYGFFSLSYIDATSSVIELPISMTSHNIILPQEKTIEEFIFLITDDNTLDAGYGSGYISDIRLIWNPSISITIVTISLIMVIIPLIIMIVPTLAIYSKYGKSVIMPVFILMCIICFAGGLIPAWLFFILMIGSGGFLVLRKGSDV